MFIKVKKWSLDQTVKKPKIRLQKIAQHVRNCANWSLFKQSEWCKYANVRRPNYFNSSMNKRHGKFHWERYFKINSSTANILISRYRLTNKYKPCLNFLKNLSIVDRVNKNKIINTKISIVNCKIRKPREIKYFDANVFIHKLSKQFCFFSISNSKDFHLFCFLYFCFSFIVFLYSFIKKINV